jgi:GntR family transcriptional regulator
MLFTINPSDGLPIYRQIVRQVKHAVASGKLAPGDKLPSQRDLSSELVINHLTVKKAYEVLEAEGIIATERGRGTFVAAGVPHDLRSKGMRDIKARARDVADAAQLLALDFKDYRKITDDAWTESQEGKGNRT